MKNVYAGSYVLKIEKAENFRFVKFLTIQISNEKYLRSKLGRTNNTSILNVAIPMFLGQHRGTNSQVGLENNLLTTRS